jgi:hypothetical protein
MPPEGNLPIPDPTTLTTEQILREVLHLRQLIEERMSERDHRYQQRAEAQQMALEAALVGVERRSSESESNLQQGISYLDSLTESKFVTFRTLAESQADKVALALDAADKAVTKAETANEKRYEALIASMSALSGQSKNFVTRPEFETVRVSLSEKIDDLKAFALRTEGRGAGLSAGWGYLAGAFAIMATAVGVILAVKPG